MVKPITRNSKILIVDDFSVMRRIVKNLLKDLGFSEFVEAVDGASAIEAIQRENPDFICSDWNMPNVTGLDLLKWVKTNPQYKHIPFLMITAEAKRSQILEAAGSGVDGYIVKPFTAQQLNEKINKIIERNQEKLS